MSKFYKVLGNFQLPTVNAHKVENFIKELPDKICEMVTNFLYK